MKFATPAQNFRGSADPSDTAFPRPALYCDSLYARR